MTIEERVEKLGHLITCMKCEVSGKVCAVTCPVQYNAGNMGEIIENLEEILKYVVRQYEDQESTTKNDLVSSIVEKISEKVTETRDEFIFETIRPYCENMMQMKISKRDLEQALLKYYGKYDY